MFEYKLPDVGEGVAEGEIVEWHVDVGDEVVEDQVLAEVETDKAVVDLPSPVDGVIAELHADAGDIVAVGSVVVTIDTDGSGAEPAGTEESMHDADEASQIAGDDGQAAAQTGQHTGGRVFAPPNVRRLARELGVNITTVDGSGPSGRISEEDVRTAAEGDTEDEQSTESTEQAKSAVRRRESSDESASERKSAVRRREPSDSETPVAEAAREKTLAAPATRQLATELGVELNAVPTEKSRDGHAVVESDDVRAFAEAKEQETTQRSETTPRPQKGVSGQKSQTGDPVRTEPYRGIRRTIGQRMSQSAFTAPHATHHDTAVVPGLVEARATLKPAAESEGVKLTYMPFIMKAIATVLPQYPPLNAELDSENEEIHYHQEYHIGVAVATDAGLMVPVVRNVEQKGLLELAEEVNDLVSRARTRELTPEELQGSTFTITNFGAIGGEYATPILNYPETGILGLGELRKRPVVEDDEVVARETLPLSLSIDHRVVDGADSAAFCNELKTYLETPTKLLL